MRDRHVRLAEADHFGLEVAHALDALRNRVAIKAVDDPVRANAGCGDEPRSAELRERDHPVQPLEDVRRDPLDERPLHEPRHPSMQRPEQRGEKQKHRRHDVEQRRPGTLLFAVIAEHDAIHDEQKNSRVAEEREGDEDEEDDVSGGHRRWMRSQMTLDPHSRPSYPIENRLDQGFRYANGSQRLLRLHGAVIVGAAGDELAAEAREVRIHLAILVVDVGVHDFDRVDAGVQQLRHDRS